MLRWWIVGGLLIGLGVVAYELGGREPAPRAPVEATAPTPAAESTEEPAPAPPPRRFRVTADKLAWTLYLAREREMRAAVAAQALFPEMHARLVDDLTDDNFDRTQGAIAAIRYLGSEKALAFLPAIAEALDEGRITGALYAALEEIGEPASGLSPVLVEKLEDAVANAPRDIHTELIPGIDIGTPASALGAVHSLECIAALRATILEPIEFLPDDAIEAVEKLGECAAGARPELVALMRRRHFELDEHVARAFVATDPTGEEILPQLRQLAEEPRAPRASIAQAFRFLAAAGEAERLAGWLDREYGRRDALDALASFGPKARVAIPALERLIETWDDDERAYVALGAIAPERVPALIAEILARPPRLWKDGELGEFEWDERPANLATLGVWGERARAALPKIVEALKHPRIHPNTLVAAARIDPRGDSWVPTARAWLTHKEWEYRSWAVAAFRHAKRFDPALVALLADELLRDDIADFLAERGEVPAELVPQLMFEEEAALRALAHAPGPLPLQPLVRFAGKFPRTGLDALAKVDRSALRKFVEACAPRDAPPTPETIDRVLARWELSRADARELLETGLPDARCVEGLAWLD